jgi:CRP/FNR family transcriptional regulator
MDSAKPDDFYHSTLKITFLKHFNSSKFSGMPTTLNPLSCLDCRAWKRSLFAELDEKSLRGLDRAKTTLQLEKGESLSRQGQNVNEVYCLAQGAAKIVKRSERPTKESIVRIATAGEMVGYRCIFSEEVYRATAVTVETTVTCKMHKDVMLDLIRENPDFAIKMLVSLGQEVAAAENRHHSFCLKNTRERVAEALLIVAKKCGVETSDGIRLEIQLLRTDWAEWIGIAKENLIRCFSDFKKEGLIRQDGEHILIVDMRRLETTAQV